MAKLRYSTDDHELFEVEIGDKLWTDECPVTDDDEEPYVLLDDATEPHLVVLEDAAYMGLKPNTVYRLVEVPTILEADSEIEMPGEEGDDNEGSAEELN